MSDADRSGGFAAFVGNPPFLGGKRITTVHGEAYRDWLAAVNESSNSSSDYVAYFYRRAFDMLRAQGAFGLLATNTIAQGDTRATGLRWLCGHEGVIYNAIRRNEWPGAATVVTSIVHVLRAPLSVPSCRLNGRAVSRISAFLFHDGGDDDPQPLAANAGLAFIGCYLRGMGFTFDDGNEDATTIAEMRNILKADPECRERVYPYLGGEELNSHPEQTTDRFVIDFSGMSVEDARTYPRLFSILERKVKPERMRLGSSAADRPHKERWWRFANERQELRAALQDKSRVLAAARVTQHLSFVFVDPRQVFSEQVVVVADDRAELFAVLQSRVHELWARFFSSTMGEALRYAPTDAFETFAMPLLNQPLLVAAGTAYHDARGAVMRAKGVGLTQLYSQFHDADCEDADIADLRRLHDDMDRCVLDAYGWTDVRPNTAFVTDSTGTDDEVAATRVKRGRVRLRWTDDVRDEVLARLLALNKQRATEERRAGPGLAKATTPREAESVKRAARRKRA